MRVFVVLAMCAACGRIGFDAADDAAVTCNAFTPVDSGTSETASTTYYVAPTGDDTRSCATAMDPATPRQTIRNGFDCVQPGETLVLRGGTYDEEVSNYAGPIRGGTSWSSATHVVAFPGETPIIRPTSGVGRVLTLIGQEPSWMIFEKIVFDGANTQTDFDAAIKITYGTDPADATHHVRFLGGAMINSPVAAFAADGIGNELIGVDIARNGTPSATAAISPESEMLIERCRIHDNRDRSIAMFSTNHRITGVRIRYNEIYNNPSSLLVSSSDEAEVYGNVIRDNGGGVQVTYEASTGTRVWHNTIVDNDGSFPYCVGIDTDAVDTDVRNNICVGSSLGIGDTGANSLVRSNMMSDPGFADRTAHRLWLAAGSSALDAGEELAGSPYAGAAPDSGAFEAPVATAATRCDPQTIDVAIESRTPLAVENCGGFVVQTAAGVVPVESCTVGVGAIRLKLAAPVDGRSTLVHDGSAVTDTARVGDLYNAPMNAFTLDVEPPPS